MTNLDLFTFKLSAGSHPNPKSGMCHQEAAAWMAGEPHSDHPKCVAPSLGAFARVGQDGTPDELRYLWNATVLKCLDTVSPQHEAERNEFMLHAIFRQLIPIALDGWLDKEAGAFRALPADGPLEEFIKQARNLDLALALDLARALDLDLDLARALAVARARALDLAKPLDRVAYFTEMVAIFNEAIELGPYNREELYDVPRYAERIEQYRREVVEAS